MRNRDVFPALCALARLSSFQPLPGKKDRTVAACLLTATMIASAIHPAAGHAQLPEAGPLRLSNKSFDFGPEIVGFSFTKTVAVVKNVSGKTVPVLTRLTGNPAYAVVGGSGCGATLEPGASCDLQIAYTPQTASTPKKQDATLLVGTISGQASSLYDITLSGMSGTLPAGAVTATGNALVAQYALTLPFPATWSVSFGPTTNYGLTTNAVATSQAGAASSLYVAGMRANTAYHMRATATFANGVTVTDVDHTFTTGAVSAGLIPPMTVTTTPGLTPQPGIELVNTLPTGTPSLAYATDLAGNVIWTYSPPDLKRGGYLYPIGLIPNGHFLMMIDTPTDPTQLNVLREVDLAGNIVQDLPMATLNSRLAAAGFANLTLQVYSHEVMLLPSGHILLLATTLKPFTDLPGYPGVTNVQGDVVVDLDQNLQPVWIWNEFDHFDVNRHPMGFPDWTHSNAIAYSTDDQNILVSMRHQNWVVKVNYNAGQGDGSVLWKLGYQGDFALQGGTEPQDWFFAQHYPSFFSANTTGSFTLGVMDNGDDRAFPDGTNCLTQSYRCYTTIPVMQVDEIGKTAAISWRQTLPSNLYSAFAGDTVSLANGNVEYNLAGVGSSAHVFEVTKAAVPETVWHMYVQGTNTYRAFRLPSLYPGVQW